VLVVGIGRILPDGDVFGSVSSDEFTVEFEGERKGIFKRFEYLSLPFSITGNREKFNQLIQRAGENETSFRQELEKDPEAQRIVENVFSRMDSSQAFSKQILDHLLGRVYVDDNVLSRIGKGDSFESHLAKVVVGWKHLADFYCIEGLVGGDGERNPFREDQNSSFIAGGLDSLETTLPILRQKVDERAWKEICLKLSSVVGRDYKQIVRAVDVLGIVFGKEGEMSEEEVQQSTELINELSASTFKTNADIGKLYNTLIRFHNWVPLPLRQNGPDRDTYDSICVPAKKALGMLDEASEVAQALSEIKDATSPKGLALATLIDDGKIGNKSELARCSKDLEGRLSSGINEGRKDFSVFTFEDSAFYTGLTGGKWKGLKLLHDAKEALGLTYQVPAGFVISSMITEKVLNETGIMDVINAEIFSIDEKRRQQIIALLNRADFERHIPDEMLISLGDDLIVRSSMYGEDGSSNFSGTYESVACRKEKLGDALRDVVKSYFSREAIASREDIGLAHVPGISCVIQQRIKGQGGVIHLTNSECSVSFAETPEDAVNGNGTLKSTRTIRDTLEGTRLEALRDDLCSLYKVFGDSDIEFVIDDKANVYLTQLRPKYRTPELISKGIEAERMVVSSLDDLPKTVLDRKYIVTMSFLGRDNIMNREGEIMDFIRKNKEYIVAIEGNMPSVAHIPNKIEGHFRIPYLVGGTKNDK
jgi:hypothetical protein